MSQIAKFLLVATSLTPAIGAFALIEWQKNNWQIALSLVAISVLFVFICHLLRLYPEKFGQRKRLEITAVEGTDKEALAFLIAYLFPILTGKIPDLSEPQYWLLTAYVFFIIGVTIYHSNAFHFNPVLAALGYHFYQVTADGGMKYLLIARHVVRSQKPDIVVTRLAPYVYLEVNDGQEQRSDENKSLSGDSQREE
jgi:hypothetical protein